MSTSRDTQTTRQIILLQLEQHLDAMDQHRCQRSHVELGATLLNTRTRGASRYTCTLLSLLRDLVGDRHHSILVARNSLPL
jgi:hypothetical protein